MIQAVAGASSAAFRTAALPQTSAGKNLPGHVGDRRVRGDDQTGHADRPAQGHGHLVRFAAGARLAVEALALAGEEQTALDRGSRLADALRNRLACLGGHDASDPVGVVLHQAHQLVQQQATLDGRCRVPGGLGRASGDHRGVHVGRLATRELAKGSSVVRIGLDRPRSVGGGTLHAVDPVRNAIGHQVGRPAHHQAVQPPSMVKLEPVM